MKFTRLSAFATLFVLLAFSASAKSQDLTGKPLVMALSSRSTGCKPGVVNSTHADCASESVNVSVTLNKNLLFGQEYLYGADLQYSSSTDSGLNLYNQSMALGHEVVHFRIAGDELQLIADDTLHFPSAVNHPEQLISRFKVLSQTATTLTVSGMSSAVYLAEIYAGTNDGTALASPTGKPPRDSWVRSFDFAPKGNYLLQQTSVTMDDGTLVEFMESIFPRANLAVGKNFQKFEMDPANPVGASSGPIARYRFLSGNPVYHGEKHVAYGQHFDLSAGADGSVRTLDWYVTPNIPDEDLAPVKLAVEGWNRYFKKELGVTREVVQFKGRLPNGIYIGDPRFNVINWDSVRVAGAAYETQASDPETGNQSHSLIYMPAAWLEIGMNYWKIGQYSNPSHESVAPKALKGVTSSARLACTRDVTDALMLMNSGRLETDEIQKFSFQLLKQTLFHEVGHSLGLAHNFKGSLSYDPKNPGTLFSTSIMDYNDYEIERGAFYGVDTSDGPQLEYDRQAISSIYNQSRDVLSTDDVISTCNDEEADTEETGVDPLCIRYDIQHDPTWSVDTALTRINASKLEGDTSLAQAIARAETQSLDKPTVASVKDKEALAAAIEKTKKSIIGALNYYFVGGKASLTRVVKTNVKSLYQFEDSVLPSGYSELQMRERAFNGVQKSIAMLSLPVDIRTALNRAVESAIQRLQSSPYAQSSSQARSDLTDAKAALVQAFSDFETSEEIGLPKVRTALFTALARHKAVPFYFGTVNRDLLDYETAIVGILAEAIEDINNRAQGERLAAAKSLETFSGRLSATSVIARVTKKLNAQLKAATGNDERENAMALLTALQSSTDIPDGDLRL